MGHETGRGEQDVTEKQRWNSRDMEERDAESEREVTEMVKEGGSCEEKGQAYGHHIKTWKADTNQGQAGKQAQTDYTSPETPEVESRLFWAL